MIVNGMERDEVPHLVQDERSAVRYVHRAAVWENTENVLSREAQEIWGFLQGYRREVRRFAQPAVAFGKSRVPV